MPRTSSRTALCGKVGLALLLAASAPAQPTEKLKASLERIFNSNEFSSGERGGGRRGAGGGTRWIEGGQAYAAIEGGEIVRYDAATGKREVWVSRSRLGGRPITDFAWSADGKKLMVATNPHRVLIRKNAAAYSVLDIPTGAWRRLGGANGADLLFAKLSPDGTRAAYIRGTNLFVEDLATGANRPLTSDGTDLILNGVSDWVYDEEFSLADGFRWSPDGQRIAYFQFDQTGVPVYTLINYTDALYPTLFQYPYPKAGQTNSAIRVGVVSVQGGATTWMKAPGDPRGIYIPRMEWAGTDELIFEQLNRLQNTLDVQLASVIRETCGVCSATRMPRGWRSTTNSAGWKGPSGCSGPANAMAGVTCTRWAAKAICAWSRGTRAM